jgi:hypothetical protein
MVDGLMRLYLKIGRDIHKVKKDRLSGHYRLLKKHCTHGSGRR